jgi:prepilin-type N-terminal cleavage/methylation domain-containing protein
MLKKNGFTLVEIMIVVAIIGLLMAMVIPSFVRARQTSQRDVCINNLRLISGAKSQWALEYGVSSGGACNAADIIPYLKKAAMPVCPVGDAPYIINAIATAPQCSSGVADHVLP